MTSPSSSDDDITVSDRPQQSRYELAAGGERIGLIDYRLNGETIAYLHAEIDPAHGGQGLGSRMTREVLDDARRRGLAIVPMCPFVAAFVDRHGDEYGDLVA